MGFWVIAQKSHSHSVPWKSYPTEGYAVEHSICKPLFLTRDSFTILLSLLAWYDIFPRVPGQPHAFYKLTLYQGVCECVSDTNMLYLPCLNVTVLIQVEFIQGNLLSNYSFFFFSGLELKGAQLTLVKIRKAGFII